MRAAKGVVYRATGKGQAPVRLSPDGTTYGGLYFTGGAQVLDGTAAHPGGFGISLDPVADADAEQLANLLRQLADERFADRAAQTG